MRFVPTFSKCCCGADSKHAVLRLCTTGPLSPAARRGSSLVLLHLMIRQTPLMWPRPMQKAMRQGPLALLLRLSQAAGRGPPPVLQ